MGDLKMEKKFDTMTGGWHQVCLHNQERDEIKADLRIKSGDFGSANQAITKRHLKPVEAEALTV